MPAATNLSPFISFYLSLSPTQKRIVLYLFSVWKETKKVFPSVRWICHMVRCKEASYKKFMAGPGQLLFKREAIFEPSGRQTSNNIYFDPTFLRALQWLEIYGYMKAKKSRYSYIISSIENQENVTPPPPQNVTPFSRDSNLRRDRFKSTPPKPPQIRPEYVHPTIQKIGIPQNHQIRLSKYPEVCIARMMERTLWFRNQGNRIDDPVAVLDYNMRAALKEHGFTR